MRKLTIKEKHEAEDNLWGADAICKGAVIVMACILGIPALFLIWEFFYCRPTSILYNMFKSR